VTFELLLREGYELMGDRLRTEFATIRRQSMGVSCDRRAVSTFV
jgi:hypothetical protein